MDESTDFDRTLREVEALLRADRRVAYRILKRRFDLDDDDIEDIKADLIDAKRIAYDENNRVLVLDDPHPRDGRAERRQLTVMFCDIVGSTELAERLDPEDLRELIRRYQQTCGGIIDDAGGHVAQYLGDGLLVYFGYPIAFEDAAVRAVSCGMEIIAAMANVRTDDGEPLKVRIGVHTGTVVIGDIGGGANREQLALGETPNVAARIESQAGANELLVSEASLRLLQGMFDTKSRGSAHLRGVTAPVPLYLVVRARDFRTRYQALRRANPGTIAGRERELKQLFDAWETTRQGNHAKYYIHAEAGVGKSRLIQEIRERARGYGGTPMTVVCSPLHADTALYPFIELIHRVLRVRQDDPPAVRLTRLREVLAGLRFPGEDTEDILAALLSLKQEFGSTFQQLDAAQRRQRTFDTILDWIAEVATRAPALLVLEDLQAADRSTLDLIEQGLDRFDDTATLMLLVARDEFSPPWGRRADIIDMPLRRLNSAAIRKIISDVCGGCSLPLELIERIEEKSDGVPLYAEEFTKMVLESDLLVKSNGHYELVRTVRNLAIPSSLQDSLLARLDRLRDGKGVAQWGATIGREFSYELIKALLPDEIADNGLKELLELGIIYKRKRTLQTMFIFKHALIQDAAYASLLRSERREYHARVARVLIEEFPRRVEERPELVARHLTRAERCEEAVAYWILAGEAAARRATHVEALAHYDRGLQLLGHVPAGRAHDALELQIQMARGPLLVPLRGNASESVHLAFTRALELSHALNATRERFRILVGLRSYFLTGGNLAKAHDLSRELFQLAQETGDPGEQLEAHTGLANTYFFQGNFLEVEKHASAALAIYDPERFRHHTHVYGSDPGVVCLSRLAIASWQRGAPDRGRVDLEAMLELAEDSAHLFTLTSALNIAALLRSWRHEPQLAYAAADRSFRISEANGFRFTYAWSRMLRGQAIFDLGRREDGMREVEYGFGHTEELNTQLMEPWLITVLANTKMRYGDCDAAADLIARAYASIAASGTNFALPAVHCLDGELHLNDAWGGHDPDAAYSVFNRGIELARSHGSHALEAHALYGALRSRRDRPEEQATLEQLRRCLAMFTPGDDSKDLVDALALVERYAAATLVP